MAKITGCTYHDGVVYFADKKGRIFPATFPDSPTR